MPQRNDPGITNHYFNSPGDGASHGHVKEQRNNDGSVSYPFARDVKEMSSNPSNHEVLDMTINYPLFYINDYYIICIMNVEKLYKSLNSELTPGSKRVEFVAYLKDLVKSMPLKYTDKAETAYKIAGLMSTDYARSLSNDDNLDKIITIAGELEIEDSSNDSQWVELIKLINDL